MIWYMLYDIIWYDSTYMIISNRLPMSFNPRCVTKKLTLPKTVFTRACKHLRLAFPYCVTDVLSIGKRDSIAIPCNKQQWWSRNKGQTYDWLGIAGHTSSWPTLSSCTYNVVAQLKHTVNTYMLYADWCNAYLLVYRKLIVSQLWL